METQAFTKEITTPIGKDVVVFKTLVSGAERERIDTANLRFVKTNDGKSFSEIDTAGITLANKHELLKVSVLSINGDMTNCFERLQKMYDVDYKFIYDSILEEQKKILESAS